MAARQSQPLLVRSEDPVKTEIGNLDCRTAENQNVLDREVNMNLSE
jgi:hypothetical protein